MSLQLQAVHIYSTHLPAISQSHNGGKCVREDLPINSIIAEDAEGNFYLYQGFMLGDKMHLKTSSWSKPKNGVMPLWRDYWVALSADRKQMAMYLAEGLALHPKVSPHNAAFYNAGLKTIR